MANASFSQIVQNLQSDIITILNTDTTTTTFTYSDSTTATRSLSNFKIVDGMPSDLLKGTGFPYIIVHTPTERTSKKTLSAKYQSMLEIQIEVYDRREGNVRILIDMVRDAIKRGISTWMDRGMFFLPMGTEIRSTISVSMLPSEPAGKPVWFASLFVPFKWSGS